MNGLKRMEMVEAMPFHLPWESLEQEKRENRVRADFFRYMQKVGGVLAWKKEWEVAFTEEETTQLLLVEPPAVILAKEATRIAAVLRYFLHKHSGAPSKSMQKMTRYEVDVMLQTQSPLDIVKREADRLIENRDCFYYFWKRWQEELLLDLEKRDVQPVGQPEGVSGLTRDEIDEWLQVKSPREIRESESNRLNPNLLRYLKSREENPNIVDHLRESARLTREMIDQSPEDELEKVLDPEPESQSRIVGKKTVVTVPFPIVFWTFLIALVLGVSFFLKDGPPQDREEGLLTQAKLVETRDLGTVIRMANEPGAQPFDHALFQALKSRGMYFFKEAEKLGEGKVFRHTTKKFEANSRKIREFYQEAVTDLSQALDLNRSDEEAANYLRKALNRLDDLI